MAKTRLSLNVRKNLGANIWSLISLLLLLLTAVLVWMVLAQLAELNRNLENLIPHGCVVRYTDKESPVIYPPEMVEKITHKEMIEFLRIEFPNAMFRGVESAQFELTTRNGIEKFLREAGLNTSKWSGVNCVLGLAGSFSTQASWEEIPIGWVKNDRDFYAITVVRDNNVLKILGIDCTGRMWEVNDTSVKFVFVG